MLQFMNFLRRPALIAGIVLILSGCVQAPLESQIRTQTMPATQPRIVPATLTPTEAVPSASPTVHSPATRTPEPTSTGQPAMLEAGEPFWLGRGRIVDVIFLPGAAQVAIAWGSGVSLHTVESGTELWFQPTTTNLIAFSVQPQAQMLAAALSDGSVMVFKAGDGQSQRFEVARPNAYWGDIAWAPDGKTIAVQFIGPNRRDPIYLLDAGSGQINEVPDSQTSEGVIPVLIWSPDSLSITIASLGEDCSRFVDVQTGKLRMMLSHSGQCYIIHSLVFLPDGQTLAVSGSNGVVDLLRFPDGKRLQNLPSPIGELNNSQLEFPAIDPSGRWIASRGGYEPCYCGNPNDLPFHWLIVWDLASGTVQAQLERAIEPLTELRRLAIGFDGEEIVMLYENGAITRWKFNDPQAEEILTAQVPARPVSAWSLRWSADGSHLAFTGSYGGVDIYETDTQQLIRRFDPPLDSPALSPDGGLIALYDPVQSAEIIYEVQSGRVLQTLPAAPVLMGASFSPDGQYIAFGDGARAAVAEVASGGMTILDPAPAAPVDANMATSRLIWSPDGRTLATVFGAANGNSVGPGVIVIWKRLENGSFEAVYHVSNVQANYPLPNQMLAIFNPSGSRVALQSIDTLEAGDIKLIVYDLESRKGLQTFSGYKPGAWVNDEELLAAEAQYDIRLTRINVETGEMTVGRGRDIGDNAYAPGGIFTAQMAEPPARGVTVRYWESNAIVAQLDHESLNLLDYGWSPDGRWLASIGDDGTLHIWPINYP